MVELTGTPHAFNRAHAEAGALVHVPEGSVHLVTDGISQTLESGDCAYMETRMPTSLSAVRSKRCRILPVLPGPAEPTAS